MNRRSSKTIGPEMPPVVELDSEAHAAYVRFNNQPVAKTELLLEGECIVTADYDANGEVVGVELIGVKEFGIVPLLKTAGLPPLRKVLSEQTRYISVLRRDLTTA